MEDLSLKIAQLRQQCDQTSSHLADLHRSEPHQNPQPQMHRFDSPTVSVQVQVKPKAGNAFTVKHLFPSCAPISSVLQSLIFDYDEYGIDGVLLDREGNTPQNLTDHSFLQLI